MDEAEQKAFDEIKVAKELVEAKLKTKTEEHQKAADEHKKLLDEVGGLRAKAVSDQKAAEDIAKAKAETDKAAKEKLLLERKAELVKKGLPEDKVKTLSEEGLTIAELAVSARKPGADMGGGGSVSALQGLSLFELGQLAYTKK